VTRWARAGGRISRFHVFLTVAGLGMGMTGSLTAVYAKALGASDTAAGVAVASISVSLLVVDVLGTRVVPSLDSRLSISLALAIFGVGSLASAAAPTYAWMVAARVFQGAGAALFMTGGLQAAVRMSEPGREGRAVGAFNMAFFLGVASGPLLSAAVSEVRPGLDGLRAAFAVCAFTNLVAAVLCRLGLPSMPTGLRPRLALPPLGLLARPRLGAVLLLGAFGQAVQVGIPFTMIPLLATDRLGLPVPALSAALSVLAVSNIMAMSLAGRASDRVGRLWGLLPALVWGAGVLVLTGRAAGLGPFVICCAAIGVTVGSVVVVPAAMVVDLAADRTAAISGYRISADLGQLAGAAGAGALFGAVGPSGALDVAAAGLFLAGVLVAATGDTSRCPANKVQVPAEGPLRRA
jgi:MFS transporter, DHA1 family, inner membrane transport protein